MKTASLFYCAFCDRAECAVNFPSAAVLSGREFSSHRRTNCDDFVSSRSRQQCELSVMNMPTPQFNRFQNGGRPPFWICKIKNNSLCNPKGIFASTCELSSRSSSSSSIDCVDVAASWRFCCSWRLVRRAAPTQAGLLQLTVSCLMPFGHLTPSSNPLRRGTLNALRSAHSRLVDVYLSVRLSLKFWYFLAHLYNFMWLMCMVYFICSFFQLRAFLYLLCAFVILPVIKIIIYLILTYIKGLLLSAPCLISRD